MEDHPASYPMGTEGPNLFVKRGEQRRPLTPIYCRGQERGVPPLPLSVCMANSGTALDAWKTE
jgi:hypothetical protein